MSKNIKFDRKKLSEIVNTCNTYKDILIKLNIEYDEKIIFRLKYFINKNNIDVTHFESVQRLVDSQKRYDEDYLKFIVPLYNTYSDILNELGIKAIESNYKTLKKYIKLYNIDISHIKKVNNIKYERDNFEKIVKESYSFSEVKKRLNIGKKGNNNKTIKRYIELYKLDISHFIKYDRKTQLNELWSNNSYELIDILVEKSTYRSTNNLKKRLYKEELKERKCEICGQGEVWKGNYMALILDHINGVNDDNRLENLRILCPNCNATLPTHCRGYKGLLKKDENIKNTKDYCECGELKEKSSKCCVKCNSKKHRKVERPLYEILVNEIKELGYCGTGRKYGVSDTAIRKWIKKYETNN